MKLFSFIALAMAGSTLAHAAGFEKAVLWSGKEAGYGAAGMSRITSSESLFFNPAGLAGGNEQGDFTLNVSPTDIKLSGGIASNTVKEETDKNYTTVGSAFVKYKINENFGLGVGAYVAGGSKAVYNSVSLTSDQPTITALTPEIRTELAIVEYSIGAGYQLMPGLRFGAAWRISHVDGGFSTIKKTIANTAYSYIDLKDAKQTKYNGFRVGLQYSPDDTWGVGATWRNTLNFNPEATGTGSTTIIPTRVTSATTVSKTSIGTSLPWALSVGGNTKIGDNFRFLAAMDWVRYSINKALMLNGTITSGTTVASIPNLPLNWKDMYNVRLGGEFALNQNVMLKAGYVFTSQVTPTRDARATLTPPGTGHTYTVGAGTSLMDGKLGLDGAFEYATNTANGFMSPTYQSDTTKELLATQDTEFKAKVMAVHVGASYKF